MMRRAIQFAGMNEKFSYDQVATSCRSARISEADDNANE